MLLRRASKPESVALVIEVMDSLEGLDVNAGRLLKRLGSEQKREKRQALF
jgi:hypothetical protein